MIYHKMLIYRSFHRPGDPNQIGKIKRVSFRLVDVYITSFGLQENCKDISQCVTWSSMERWSCDYRNSTTKCWEIDVIIVMALATQAQLWLVNFYILTSFFLFFTYWSCFLQWEGQLDQEAFHWVCACSSTKEMRISRGVRPHRWQLSRQHPSLVSTKLLCCNLKLNKPWGFKKRATFDNCITLYHTFPKIVIIML